MKTRDLHEVFLNHAAALWRRWEHFRNLFCHSKTRFEILHAPEISDFMDVVDRSLRADVIMMICRLMDREQTCGRSNFVIGQVVKQLGKQNTSEIRRQINKELAALRPLMPDLRRMRNETLAHNDLETATGMSKPSSSKWATVDRAVAAVCRIANLVLLSHGGPPFDFHHVSSLAADKMEVILTAGLQSCRAQQLAFGANVRASVKRRNWHGWIKLP